MTKLETAKQLLNGSVVLAIVNGDKIFTSSLRGVSALLSVYNDNPQLLNGAYIADKVVGKAAAMLMVLGKVNEVFAINISENAAKVFQKYVIPFSFLKIADYIKNREGTGVCPLEQAVADIDNPILALKAINDKLNFLRGIL